MALRWPASVFGKLVGEVLKDAQFEAVTIVPNTYGRIGPGRWSAGKVLKRVVSWTGDGFTWEADPRRWKVAEIAESDSMERSDSSRARKTLGKTIEMSTVNLSVPKAKVVQAAAGLEKYIAHDCPDIAASVKTTLQQMSKPTKMMKLRVIKVAGYLKSNPRFVLEVPISTAAEEH